MKHGLRLDGRERKNMAKKKTQLYPGIEAAEKERSKRKNAYVPDDLPDMIETAAGIAPNYEKFSGWNAEMVLTWCNID